MTIPKEQIEAQKIRFAARIKANRMRSARIIEAREFAERGVEWTLTNSKIREQEA